MEARTFFAGFERELRQQVPEALGEGYVDAAFKKIERRIGGETLSLDRIENKLRSLDARKIQRFFAQAFFVAEAYTRQPGIVVSRVEALRTCRDILDGVHDRLPEQAFYFTGGIDDIRAKAGTF